MILNNPVQALVLTHLLQGTRFILRKSRKENITTRRNPVSDLVWSELHRNLKAVEDGIGESSSASRPLNEGEVAEWVLLDGVCKISIHDTSLWRTLRRPPRPAPTLRFITFIPEQSTLWSVLSAVITLQV